LLNPNKAFQSRHRVNPDNHKELAGMMISLVQKQELTGISMRLGIPWGKICWAVLGKYKNMSDCTFYEAGRCLITASVWKNREEAGIK